MEKINGTKLKGPTKLTILAGRSKRKREKTQITKLKMGT